MRKPESRRLVLKSLIAGLGITASLPGKWQKPIVKIVLVPAHASTTEAGPLGDDINAPVIVEFRDEVDWDRDHSPWHYYFKLHWTTTNASTCEIWFNADDPPNFRVLKVATSGEYEDYSNDDLTLAVGPPRKIELHAWGDGGEAVAVIWTPDLT